MHRGKEKSVLDFKKRYGIISVPVNGEGGEPIELSELTAYAGEKYQMQEQHKWADFPGFSVLCHPQTGKWVALLMRQWDTDSGREIESCDLKCGNDSLFRYPRPYLSSPVRMQGGRWINVRFDERTESEVVFLLFEKAVEAGTPHGYTLVLGSQQHGGEGAYQDTPLPFAGSTYRPPEEKMPGRLREMRRLYRYGRESEESRAENFCKQAVFMRDYEDDFPWSGDFFHYYPTYQDLTVQQLRGYFTWRAGVRRGEYRPIAASAAYLYLYELLNGVGADSPEDAFEKMTAFEAGYLDTGIGDARMRQNLRRWMLEFAVLHALPPELARQAADPELIRTDRALHVLREPDRFPDEELFPALLVFGGKRTGESPVFTLEPERGRHLFCEAWRKAAAYRWQEKSLFTLCFGRQKTRRWMPLSNAVYYDRSGPGDRDYALDECRSYRRRKGAWQAKAYDRLSFDLVRFRGFLHETDALLRRYLKTGRYLKENPADEWALPYISAVIEADRKALLEAERPKITIDLSGLEQIRRDASATRDSLLTEEELEELEEAEEAAAPAAEDMAEEYPQDTVQMQILRALLRGEDPAAIIREGHLMPSVAADIINEALFDEIGDTVLVCEGDRLSLVEDYREELEQYLGGNNGG